MQRFRCSLSNVLLLAFGSARLGHPTRTDEVTHHAGRTRKNFAPAGGGRLNPGV